MKEAENIWSRVLEGLKHVRRVVHTLKISGEKIMGLKSLWGLGKGLVHLGGAYRARRL